MLACAALFGALTRAPTAIRDLILSRTAKCHARARVSSLREYDRLSTGEKILFFTACLAVARSSSTRLAYIITLADYGRDCAVDRPLHN